MKINNKISMYSLYLKTIKIQNFYSSIDDSVFVLVFESNNADFKKLSQVLSEQTRDSFAFIKVVRLLKLVLNCEQHFSLFTIRSGLARVYSIPITRRNIFREPDNVVKVTDYFSKIFSLREFHVLVRTNCGCDECQYHELVARLNAVYKFLSHSKAWSCMGSVCVALYATQSSGIQLKCSKE
jgi:hypothetical protein